MMEMQDTINALQRELSELKSVQQQQVPPEVCHFQ